MKTHQNEHNLPATEKETSRPSRRGIFAGVGALVASGLSFISLQPAAQTASADSSWSDGGGYYGHYDPYYGGYYYDPYYGGYYYDDDDWDDDDGWDDDDWD
jgi:hypothetical protein